MKINIKADTNNIQEIITLYLLADSLLDMKISERINKKVNNQIITIL